MLNRENFGERSAVAEGLGPRVEVGIAIEAALVAC